MDQEQRQHLQELYRINRNRLFELEKQQAFTGSSTPAHINLEINDIRKKLSDIEKELASLEFEMTVIEIRIKGDLSLLNDSILGATIRSVAGIMQVPENQIRVVGTLNGSILLLLVAPNSAALSLLEAFNKGEIPVDLNIEEVNVITVRCKNLTTTKDIDNDIRNLHADVTTATSKVNKAGNIRIYAALLIVLSFIVFRTAVLASALNLTLGVIVGLLVVAFSFWVADDRKVKTAKLLREKRAELFACYSEVLPLWNKIEEAKRAAQKAREEAELVKKKAEEKAKEEVRTKQVLIFIAMTQSHPHVITSASQDRFTPEPGYVWVNPKDESDLKVVWRPGRPHPKHPNLIAATDEGKWNPAPGYEWVNPKDSSNHQVRESTKAHDEVARKPEEAEEAGSAERERIRQAQEMDRIRRRDRYQGDDRRK